jgi:hypothetical protein
MSGEKVLVVTEKWCVVRFTAEPARIRCIIHEQAFCSS